MLPFEDSNGGIPSPQLSLSEESSIRLETNSVRQVIPRRDSAESVDETNNTLQRLVDSQSRSVIDATLTKPVCICPEPRTETRLKPSVKQRIKAQFDSFFEKLSPGQKVLGFIVTAKCSYKPICPRVCPRSDCFFIPTRDTKEEEYKGRIRGTPSDVEVFFNSEPDFGRIDTMLCINTYVKWVLTITAKIENSADDKVHGANYYINDFSQSGTIDSSAGVLEANHQAANPMSFDYQT